MHGSIQNECWHGNNFGLRYRSKQTQHVSSCSKCSIFIYLLCVREQRKINVRVFILYVSWGKKRRDLFFFFVFLFSVFKNKKPIGRVSPIFKCHSIFSLELRQLRHAGFIKAHFPLWLPKLWCDYEIWPTEVSAINDDERIFLWPIFEMQPYIVWNWLRASKREIKQQHLNRESENWRFQVNVSLNNEHVCSNFKTSPSL